ncbi:GTP-binding protein [Thiobacillus denitrificans ATCC 25259]|uniref:GTPase Der n=1 Tax=Thiobacillus denitrificans (strain ATCC 25259 / T1) TaxID=292415 RepID=DER_THIDA|nr:ribosome biogenesis GTPase Der [Thiobacillus denitrificans]Q3SL66.1 RecName: Full=GTPase Der; AltName: Full=GTP-binding protein EngA [Thiobacillus denitrificans ATCC 25259]AAZ96551.1 GTP-binding protein [Thiobacillus denitrificans ATCC 25259]
MLPTLVLVGRPNVGKSTLFNRLTGTRDALVHDLPGMTRDRHYGRGRIGGKPYLVVDTGGLEPVVKDGILAEMARQTLQAIDEADAIIFMVDARAGVTPQDKVIADRLRRVTSPVLLAVNKAEGMNRAVVTAEFHELGLGEPLAISGAHGDGIADLVAEALAPFPEEEEASDDFGVPKIALVGRPNVGKSTLVNALVGAERVIAFDQPGTTRDSIYVDFERGGKPYVLIDTAGVRRRGKVFETVEKFSVIKTLQAIEDANVVVLVLDARENISEQDAHLAGFVLETGRALVVAINKWDGLSAEQRDDVKRDIGRKLAFLDFARFNYISALKAKGLENLLKDIEAAHAAAFIKLSTPKLTRVLEMAVEQHAPPKNGLFRPKPRYAHQGGKNPPVIVLHGNALEGLRDDYKRYLESSFRKAFKLQGTPLRIQIKEDEGKNPFEGKKRAPLSESEATRMRRKKRVRRKVYGAD